MPTLQIRNVPNELYELLKQKSREEHRSITQQAIIELRHSLEMTDVDKNRHYLDELRTAGVPKLPDNLDITSIIREMRDNR